MRIWEIIASIKQPGNHRLINVRVEAPNQIVAREIVKAQYAGSNISIRGTPRPVNPLTPKK